SVAFSQDNFYLTTSLSKTKWEVKLSYPSDTPVPDLGKLGDVFGKGEKALGDLAVATAGFTHPRDVSRVMESMKSPLGDVLTAVDAAQGARKAKRGVNLGLVLGSPDPHPGEDKPAPGIQGTVTLTVNF